MSERFRKLIDNCYCEEDEDCDFNGCPEYYIARDDDDSALVGCRKDAYNGGSHIGSCGVKAWNFSKYNWHSKSELPNKVMKELRECLAELDKELKK